MEPLILEDDPGRGGGDRPARVGKEKKDKRKNPPINVGPPAVYCQHRGPVWAATVELGLRPSTKQGQGGLESNSHGGGALLRLAGQWRNMVAAERALGVVWKAEKRRGQIVLVYPSDSELAVWVRFAHLHKDESAPRILVHRPVSTASDVIRGYPTDTWLTGPGPWVRPDVLVVQDVYALNWVEEVMAHVGPATLLVGNQVPYHHSPGVLFHTLDYGRVPEQVVPGEVTERNPEPEPVVLSEIDAGTLYWGHSEIEDRDGQLWVVPYYETFINNYGPHTFGDVWAGSVPLVSTHVDWVYSSRAGRQRIAWSGIFVDWAPQPRPLPLERPPIGSVWVNGSCVRRFVTSIVDDVSVRLAGASGDKAFEALRSATSTRISSVRWLDLPYVQDNRAALVIGTVQQAALTPLPDIPRSSGQMSYVSSRLESEGLRNTRPGLLDGLSWAFSATRAVDAVKRMAWTAWCAFADAWEWLCDRLRDVPPASLLFNLARSTLKTSPVSAWPRFRRLWAKMGGGMTGDSWLSDVALVAVVALLGAAEESLKLVAWPVRLLVALVELLASWGDHGLGVQALRLLVHVWCTVTPMPVAVLSHLLFDAASAWIQRASIRADLARAVMDGVLDQMLLDEVELEAYLGGPTPRSPLELSRPVPHADLVAPVTVIMDGVPVESVQLWVQQWAVEVACNRPRLESPSRWNVTWQNCPRLMQPCNDIGNWLLVVHERLMSSPPVPSHPERCLANHRAMMSHWPIRDVQPWSLHRMVQYVAEQPWTGSKKKMYMDWLRQNEANSTVQKRSMTVKTDERLVSVPLEGYRSIPELSEPVVDPVQLAKTRPIFEMDATMLEYQRFSLPFKKRAEGVFWVENGQVRHCKKRQALLGGHAPDGVFAMVWVPSFTAAVLSRYCEVLTGPIAFCCGDDICLVWTAASLGWYADMRKCDRSCRALVQQMFMDMMWVSGLDDEQVREYENALVGTFATSWRDAFEMGASRANPDMVEVAAKFVKKEMYTITGHPGTSTVSWCSQLHLWFSSQRDHDRPPERPTQLEAHLWLQRTLQRWKEAAVMQGHAYDDYTLRPANGASFVGGRFVRVGPPLSDQVARTVLRWVPTAMYKPVCVCPDLAPAGIKEKHRYVAWSAMLARNEAWRLHPLGRAILEAADRTSRGYTLPAVAVSWYERKYWFQAERDTAFDAIWSVSGEDFEAMLLEQPWGGERAVRAHQECLDWLSTATFPSEGPECLGLLHDLRYA